MELHLTYCRAQAPSLNANSARAHTTDRLEMLRAYLEHAAMSEAEGSGAGAISCDLGNCFPPSFPLSFHLKARTPHVTKDTTLD